MGTVAVIVSVGHALFAAYRFYAVHKPQIDAFEKTIADLEAAVLAAYKGN